MNDLAIVTTLEFLPNEILLECFIYLNPAHIFYSFDQLNTRFNKLIHTIPLYLTFENVQKRLFDQFCEKMLLNPEMKNQIISLKLSDKKTCDQINIFLSLFSLDTFSNLRSITLDPVRYDSKNVQKLHAILPLIPKLCSFRSVHSNYALPIILLTTKLQTLAIPMLSPFLNNIHQTFSLVNLTTSNCTVTDLYTLFSYAPMLKYLNTYIRWTPWKQYTSRNNNITFDRHLAIHLETIIINHCHEEFQHFRMIVKQAPNLKKLTISAAEKTMINAYNWEDLITTSLPYLSHFKFRFEFSREDGGDKRFTHSLLEQFQTSFWQNQHHWNTEYVIYNDFACIYTTPYMLHTYSLTPDAKRYCNKLTTSSTTFDKVTHLNLYQNTIKEKCDFYFSNVESLTLKNKRNTVESTEGQLLHAEHVLFLKTTVNLNNLKHLNISSESEIDTSPVLLEILKQSPQLSLLTINSFALATLFNDDELCIYLNRMIKQLDIYMKDNLIKRELNLIEKICQVFSNLTQLKCHIQRLTDLVFLLNNLPKLSFLHVVIPHPTATGYFEKVGNKISNFKVKHQVFFDEHQYQTFVGNIYIWID